MSLAYGLFAPTSRPRAPRAAMPFASAEDLARKRQVTIRLVGKVGYRGWILAEGLSAIGAVERALLAIGRAPEAVTVEAREHTPDVVELRQSGPADQPRHILALIPEGLNIAEARAALAHLRGPAPQPKKGRR